MGKIGFIGAGNMGQAMINGLLNKEGSPYKANDIVAYDIDESRFTQLSERYGLNCTASAAELVAISDIVVLAIKPQVFDGILTSVADEIKTKLTVSIAAGKTLSNIEAILGESAKVVRAMPNTPALVGEGMSALCPNKNVSDDEMKAVVSVFESFGRAEILSENLFSTFTAISGSSPAYVFMFIEALADAAVLEGMPRKLAYEFSAQAVLGSAAMLLKTGTHPGELKDMVCSPGGTTIEAVAALERYGFRSAVINAVSFCVMKAENMGK